jgi:hypothetical protein
MTKRLLLLAFTIACSGNDGLIDPPAKGDDIIQFTAAQIASLDSTAKAIVTSNPTNPDLKILTDSTLLVFAAGVQAKRVTVLTNLTNGPLYLVGIHRAVSTASGSYSTWTLVALDNPSALANIIELAGFAANPDSRSPPTTHTGTFGDGTGMVNGLMLQVGAGGAVTTWHATSGSVSFSSGVAGAACPGFTPTPIVTCAIETMRVRFTVFATTLTGGASRQASVDTDVDVPTMRLTYTH